MKKSIIVLFFVSIFILFVAGCMNSDIVVEKENITVLSSTRAAINNRDFEWEKLRYLEFIDNSNVTRKVPAPWIPGSGMNIGVPKHFIDYNFDETSNQNLYSKRNGWRLLYHNLDLIGDSYKYLVLYNKYTGIGRAFFLSMANSNAVINTNSTFIGFHLNGNSSLLNYTSLNSFDSSKKFSNSVFVSSPTKPFNMTYDTKIINNFGVGFEVERWYAAEIEFSYDPTLSIENTLDIQITALQTSLSYSSGKFNGKIDGSIVSKASTPSSITLDFSSSNTENSTFNISMGEVETKNTMESASVKTSFLERIKKGASKWISDAFNKSAKELINGIFSMGSSTVVDAFGSLLNSFTGVNDQSQMNKVDLSINGRFNIETETVTPTNAWGHVLGLPTKGQNNIKIYPGNLGVWTLSETPKFGSKFEVTGYYQGQDPYKKIVHVACKANLFQINTPQIKINPDLENDYIVTEIKTNICFADDALDEKGIVAIFGNNNSQNIYSGVPTEFEIITSMNKTKEEFERDFAYDNKYKIENLYYNIEQFVPVYWFVSFRLKPKNSVLKDIFLSRYIKAEIARDKRFPVTCSTQITENYDF